MCADFPIQILNLPGLKFVVYICRAVEFIGIGHFTWILYYLFSFNLDAKVTLSLNSKEIGLDDLTDIGNVVSREEFKRLNQLVLIQEERLRQLQANVDELTGQKKIQKD